MIPSPYLNFTQHTSFSKRNLGVAAKIIPFSLVCYTCLFLSLDHRLHKNREVASRSSGANSCTPPPPRRVALNELFLLSGIY